jgi:hypothetical protein
MTDAKEPEKLRELERIARGNGYWNHIEPFVEAFTRERDEARVVTDAMVRRASVALWDRYGDHGVEDGDIRAMLTAALTQEDA